MDNSKPLWADQEEPTTFGLPRQRFGAYPAYPPASPPRVTMSEALQQMAAGAAADAADFQKRLEVARAKDDAAYQAARAAAAAEAHAEEVSVAERLERFAKLIATVEREITHNMPAGSPQLVVLLLRALYIHVERSYGYGTGSDPFANLIGGVEAIEREFGIELPKAATVALRTEDKRRRIQGWFKDGRLAGDSIVDAFIDQANYILMWALALMYDG